MTFVAVTVLLVRSSIVARAESMAFDDRADVIDAPEMEPPVIVGLLIVVFESWSMRCEAGDEVVARRIARGGDLFGNGCLGRIDRRDAVARSIARSP